MSNVKKLNVNYEALSDGQKRDLYLRGLLTGEIQGPLTGKPSHDKPWLASYPMEAILNRPKEGSLYDFLYESISDEPNRVLIDFLGRKITAGEILKNIDEVADSFKAKGIRKGDVVGLALPNIPESIYCIYALNKIGAIPCNIDPRLSSEGIKFDLEKAGARHFVGIDDTYSKIKDIHESYDLKSIQIIYPLQSAPKGAKFKIIKGLSVLKNLKNGNFVLNRSEKFGKITGKGQFVPEKLAIEDILGSDLAVEVHTGGTSGVHKGVRLTNSALNVTVYQHRYLMDGVFPGDTIYNPLPQFMSYGMTTVHLALCNKLYMYMMPLSNPATFGKELSFLHPNIVYGGPIHYEAGRKSQELKDADLSATKIMVTGGERVTTKEEKINNEFYGALGVQDEMYNGYGASELCGVFSVKCGKKNSAGSVGYPLPFNNVKVVDTETGEELGYNQEGELYLSGASLMMGYNNEEETVKSLKDGWFISGDIGYVNEKGELFITGRKKRQFVSGVDKVYCPVIEETIAKHPFVEKCVVVGVDDDSLRKAPYVYIVIKPEYRDAIDYASFENEINKIIARDFSESSVPKYFTYVENIEYTSQGKVDFLKMESMANEKIREKSKKLKKTCKKHI